MNLTKIIYYGISSLIPMRVLSSLAPQTTLLPYHHLVSDQEVIHVKHLYPYKSIRQFKQDLDILLKCYRPVGVDEINRALISGKSLPEKSFLLSFDDGFREVHDIVAPILTSKGIPAIFFVNPAFIDNRLLFYRCKISLVIEKLLQIKDDPAVLKSCKLILAEDKFNSYRDLIHSIKKINNNNQFLLDQLGVELEISFDEYLKKHLPFLSQSQIRSLHASGFSIGAHSLDHPYYGLISWEERVRQTVESCMYVKAIQPEGPILFSFPHSDAELPQSFFVDIEDASLHVDLYFGIQNQKTELNNRVLHRFNAERPEISMAKQLKGMMTMLLLRRLIGNEKIIRQ
jgi:peptidoglycan/xylan/chitin deacetylase (PgdA/CDA1 family)